MLKCYESVALKSEKKNANILEMIRNVKFEG